MSSSVSSSGAISPMTTFKPNAARGRTSNHGNRYVKGGHNSSHNSNNGKKKSRHRHSSGGSVASAAAGAARHHLNIPTPDYDSYHEDTRGMGARSSSMSSLVVVQAKQQQQQQQQISNVTMGRLVAATSVPDFLNESPDTKVRNYGEHWLLLKPFCKYLTRLS